ncbi:MAG: ABC transporter substrate-binding protein [Burkholderiales bacterium]|nr:MAG: ABC transporter substrate-binding protein [Burkholderiales bacterium]
MATRQLLAELVALSGLDGAGIRIESVGGVDAARRVAAGEAFDLVVLASDAIDRLMQAGHLLPGSRVDLVVSGVSVAVPEGRPLPAIDTEEALRQAVLAGGRIGFSTGPSGVALQRLFSRWGLDDALSGRLVQAPAGTPVASLLARGDADLGFQQLSELLHAPGIRIAGPMPPGACIDTVFSAAVGATCTEPGRQAAVRRFIDFMASPACDEAKRRQGMCPA